MAETALPEEGFRGGKTRNTNASAPSSTTSRFMMTPPRESNRDQHLAKGQRLGASPSYLDKHGGRRQVAVVANVFSGPWIFDAPFQS